MEYNTPVSNISTTFSGTSFFSNYWWSAFSAPDAAAMDIHGQSYFLCAECCQALWLCTCRGGDVE